MAVATSDSERGRDPFGEGACKSHVPFLCRVSARRRRRGSDQPRVSSAASARSRSRSASVVGSPIDARSAPTGCPCMHERNLATENSPLRHARAFAAAEAEGVLGRAGVAEAAAAMAMPCSPRGGLDHFVVEHLPAARQVERHHAAAGRGVDRPVDADAVAQAAASRSQAARRSSPATCWSMLVMPTFASASAGRRTRRASPGSWACRPRTRRCRRGPGRGRSAPRRSAPCRRRSSRARRAASACRRTSSAPTPLG